MRLYFGGSFNPVHNAHLRCARAVAEARGYDRVVLVPSGNPPHKPGSPELAPAEHRLAMCGLAAAGNPLFEVCDLEVGSAAPSYTIDTVRELKRRGEPEVHWLIGADMLLYLPNWKSPLELLREVTFVVMARPGWTIDWGVLPTEYRALARQVTPAPLMDVSATEIRDRLRKELPIDDLIPSAVLEYIRRHRLYSSRP